MIGLGVDLDSAREIVLRTLSPGSEPVGNELTITPRVKRVLALAQDEAVRWGVNYIGTEHILLGILRDGEGVASQVLAEMNVDPDSVRKQVVALLGGSTNMDKNVSGGQGSMSTVSYTHLLTPVPSPVNKLARNIPVATTNTISHMKNLLHSVGVTIGFSSTFMVIYKIIVIRVIPITPANVKN